MAEFFYNCTDSVWAEALLPQKDISITVRDTICVSLHFFQCAPTKASHQVGPLLSLHTLILPSAVPLHMLFPLPEVHCPSVFPHSKHVCPTTIISWGQESEDFRLHLFYIFDFQEHIVYTSHFSPSHMPSCFVIERVPVCVFIQVDKGLLNTGSWCL